MTHTNIAFLLMAIAIIMVSGGIFIALLGVNYLVYFIIALVFGTLIYLGLHKQQ